MPNNTTDTDEQRCRNDIRQQVMTCRNITEFQRKVYLALLDVPSGETITYGQLARRIGCRSAQAVGQALKRNPFAPHVPCHRVIASDGSLGGYHGATQGNLIEKKRQMLCAERKQKDQQEIAERETEDAQASTVSLSITWAQKVQWRT